MKINDVSNRLDGWTRLRVDVYCEDTGDYVTVFDSDDHCGWCPCDLDGFCEKEMLAKCDVSDIDDLDVTQFAIEDDHIVLRCELE